MANESKIFVIIPAFNEAEHIASVVDSVRQHGYQALVVDDGSNDDTKNKALSVGALVVRHEINRGQGAALQTGTEAALSLGANFFVHFDGDGQFLSTEISTLIQPLTNNQADVVFGSRMLKDNKIPFLKKKIILPMATIINWFLTGLKLSDAHCGFRALSRQAAEKIKINQNGMAHASEYLQEVKKNSLKFKEVPVTVIYHHYGQNLLGGLKILKDLILAKILK